MQDSHTEPASLSIDLFGSETRNNPYPDYRALRDAGPVCYLENLDLYAVARYEDVRDVLTNWQDFSSAQGVAMNDLMNQLMGGTVLTSDPPDHTRLRKHLAAPLSPSGLAALRPRMHQLVEGKVRELRRLPSFEAMRALAMLLPLSVVSEMVGLPEEGREQMLDWAAAAFNGMAPASVDLCAQSFPIMQQMVNYITDPTLVEKLRPDGWAAQLWKTVEVGELSAEEYRSIIQGYVSPSLDTTIFSIGNLLWLFAENPDQFAKLKHNSALKMRCINESLRIESPALGFSRVTNRDVTIDGCRVPAGARIMTLLPAANRDERRFANPDRFDITRDASQHLAFGAGVHRCVGGNLAMLEIAVVLDVLLQAVDGVEIHEMRRADNAILRGFETLEISFH